MVVLRKMLPAHGPSVAMNAIKHNSSINMEIKVAVLADTPKLVSILAFTRDGRNPSKGLMIYRKGPILVSSFLFFKDSSRALTYSSSYLIIRPGISLMISGQGSSR